jgi:type I restriction enzyme S subunit
MSKKTLKPGWRQVKFGDVVRLAKARSQDPLASGIERYVGLEHLEPGDLRIQNWGNVADGVTFTNVFQPGQVLFGKRRAYQRKVAVADFSGVCSGDIYVLEAKDAQILLPDLLPFICQSDAFFDHAVGTSAGSLSPRTNWTSLADFEFGLPPMDEQKSLVELLRTATDVSQAQEHAINVAEGLLQSFKNGAIGDSTADVTKDVLLGDVLLGSPDSGCSAPPRDADTGYFVLGLAALSRHGYVTGDFKSVEPTSKMLSAKLSKGDLLISRSNTPDRVGYVGIFDDQRNDVFQTR